MKSFLDSAKEWETYQKNTSLADRHTAEQAIPCFYECVAYEKPRFIWFNGPFSCLVGVSLFLAFGVHIFKQSLFEIPERIPNMIGDTIEDLQEFDVDLSFSKLVDKVYCNMFYTLPSASQRENILRTMYIKAKAISDVARDNEEEHDWLSFFDGCKTLGVPFSEQLQEKLQCWKGLCSSLNWWFPLEDICFLSERPAVYNHNSLFCRDFYTLDF